MELSRPVRTWEFLSATGQKAALFGSEAGRMEAWVYPLKLFRNFHVIFCSQGMMIPAESLARSITVRPESSTILYAGDAFAVRETFFVPVHESGAVILFEVDTEEPLEIEVAFQRDFQLEWPAAIGGTFIDALPDGHRFFFGEESKRFAGFVGSPTAAGLREEYQTNYSDSRESSFRLGSTARGKETKVVIVAGSTRGRDDAGRTYSKLATSYRDLLRESADYYRDYLSRTVNLELPDPDLQRAYDWARMDVIQGLVQNPDLGTGLIAGYRTSGESQRPGFAWFFGRDAFWTSFGLNSAGDFATAKTALAFVGKFQRDDGKIPHEISQSAAYVNWFKEFPYGFASADATPLYLIAMDDYMRQSGDTEFVKENWDRIWRAYQFLRSTWDEQGFPRNIGVGHGWVEGGRLLPVKTEFYQTGLGTCALRALANLARAAGKVDVGNEADQLFTQSRTKMNDAFWLSDKGWFAFALDQENRPVDELSVLTTVPMWFGLLDDQKAEQTIAGLSSFDHQTDWGMRIISGNSSRYSGSGYHYGSVWPLFTGWAAVGEYRYHRAAPAYTNLQANALLAFDGSLGHVTEVLSGTNYEPLSTSSPQQIWSAAMVVSPILRGVLGLERDATARTLTFAPHLPVHWTVFAVRNINLAGTQIDFRYMKTVNDLTLQVTKSGLENFTLNFEPALSLRANVTGVEMNGRRVEFHLAPNQQDQHLLLHLPITETNNTIHIRLRNDFGLAYDAKLPMLGEASRGLRILAEHWSSTRDTLTLEVSGRPGTDYELAVWNPREVRSVDGAKLAETPWGTSARFQLSGDAATPFASGKIVFHF